MDLEQYFKEIVHPKMKILSLFKSSWKCWKSSAKQVLILKSVLIAFIYKIKNLNEWVDSFYIFGEWLNE